MTRTSGWRRATASSRWPRAAKARARRPTSEAVATGVASRRPKPAARERREDGGQRVGVVGHQRQRLGARQPAQVARQRVDDAVEAIERHQLRAIAGVALDDQHLLFAAVQPPDELLDEHQLADAALAVDEHGDALAGARVVERRVQLAELRGAPDERARHVERACPPGSRSRARGPARARRCANRDRACQHRHAQAVDGQHVARLDQARRVADMLLVEDLHRSTTERKLSGERFVEHRADPVPVRAGSGAPAPLLRRHVRRRPHDARLSLCCGARTSPNRPARPAPPRHQPDGLTSRCTSPARAARAAPRPAREPPPQPRARRAPARAHPRRTTPSTSSMVNSRRPPSSSSSPTAHQVGVVDALRARGTRS